MGKLTLSIVILLLTILITSPPVLGKAIGNQEPECEPDQYIYDRVCHACMQCSDLHRNTSKKCNEKQDTLCGDCISGYYDLYSDSTHEATTPCHACDGESHAGCPKVSEATSPATTPAQDNDKATIIGLSTSLGFAVILMILGGVAYFCIRFWYKQREDKSTKLFEAFSCRRSTSDDPGVQMDEANGHRPQYGGDSGTQDDPAAEPLNAGVDTSSR